MHIKLENVLSEDFQSAIFESIKIAEKHNIKIYLIGGIVRDLILEKQIKDIDIAVEFDAIEFCQILETEISAKIIAIQENLHTAKVKFANGIEIDFASTREEKYTKSGVLPVAYNFGCALKDDVKRRDFTINTLAIDLTGENKYNLVDFYNGYEDIIKKQIKILHDKSFIDDPSRIVRALKFQVRFSFDLEDNTKKLMEEYLENVDKTMPLERIKGELRQYFSIKNDNIYSKIIETKAYKLICDYPVKEININYLKEIMAYDLFNEEDIWYIYILLLLVNSKVDFKRLNMTAFEKKTIKEVKELQKTLPIDIKEKSKIYKIFNDKSDIAIATFYIMTGDYCIKYFLDILKQIKVLITGKDLIEIGFIPSAYFNELFDKILKQKLDGKLKTKTEEIEFIKKFLDT